MVLRTNSVPKKKKDNDIGVVNLIINCVSSISYL